MHESTITMIDETTIKDWKKKQEKNENCNHHNSQ